MATNQLTGGLRASPWPKSGIHAALANLAMLLLSGLSHAVNLSNDSTGQVLIYPYYTANAGNQTLLSVLNFSSSGKAIKLRVLEGRNARPLLSLNLYLAPEDVWTGAIFATESTGPAALISADQSCTAPLLSQSTERLNGLPLVSFKNTHYLGDGGPSDLERTREGFVEIFEMGTILPESELATWISQNPETPSNCGAIAQRWASYSGTGVEPFAASIGPAAGGLLGTGAIVDSADGTYIEYSATVLDGFYRTSMHTRPDSALPSLRNAEPVSTVLHDGEAIQSRWTGDGLDAVSSVLMAEQLRNEFTTETALLAKSEWVITFPTKAFYVDPLLAGFQAPLPPFVVANEKAASCESVEIYSHDRSGGQPTTSVVGFTGPPPSPPPTTFCFSVNVLTLFQVTTVVDLLSSPSLIFGTKLGRNIYPRFLGSSQILRHGWLAVDFSEHISGTSSRIRQLHPSLEGHRFIGLPAIGFAAIRFENIFAQAGLRAAYAGAFAHKRKIRCVNSETNGTLSGDCFE